MCCILALKAKYKMKMLYFISSVFTLHLLFSLVFLFPFLLPLVRLCEEEDGRGDVHCDLSPDLAQLPVQLSLALRETPAEDGVAVGESFLQQSL